MAQCLTPFHVKASKISNEKIPVPCGKCPNCIKRRVSGWSFRLIKQSEKSNNPLFVTLTYSNEKVPKTKKGYKTLRKSDVQNFFKRLRKLQTEKIKYYLAGEYGTQTMRPHYHAIIFNTHEHKILRSWTLDGIPIGSIHIGRVSGASIGYTLKYLSKEGKVPHHKNDDRQPEFQLMSKGLGIDYITEAMTIWHKNDLTGRYYIPLLDGKKAPMPRYYREKIYNEAERNRINNHMAKLSGDKETQNNIEHGENVHHILAERAIAQFRKMYKKSKENEKL